MHTNPQRTIVLWSEIFGASLTSNTPLTNRWAHIPLCFWTEAFFIIKQSNNFQSTGPDDTLCEVASPIIPFSGYYRLRENNKWYCLLATNWLQLSITPPPSVLSAVEEAGHSSSAGQGNPREEKQWDNREDIVVWQLAGFPIFSSRQCENQRDSLLWGLGHCKPMLQQRHWRCSHG